MTSADFTNFIGRICMPDNEPPVRAYVHRTGLEVYGNCIPEAEKCLKQTLKENKEELSGFQYILAAMWGNMGNKIIDMFGYGSVIKWPGNPDIYAWVMKNGVFVPMNEFRPRTALTCEDTSILLGKEAEHRRNRKSLIDFIFNPPLFISNEKGQIKIVPLERTR